MRKDSIGDRMKFNYEGAYKLYMPHRFPVIIRLDGKNFHSFTKKMNRPFDDTFIKNMGLLALDMVDELQGAVFAYIQSDEISILIHGYKRFNSQALYLNEIQKIASISAGLASSKFSLMYQREAVFDSRTFVIPEAEVVNYFVWRQQDASRNSVSMTAQSLYSHKQLQNKNTSQMQDMMMEKGINWNDLPIHKRRGFAIKKKTVEYDIPLFTQDRKYIEEELILEEE